MLAAVESLLWQPASHCNAKKMQMSEHKQRFLSFDAVRWHCGYLEHTGRNVWRIGEFRKEIDE